MKPERLLLLVAIGAFVAGFWTACSIGFDPTSDEYSFSCTTNQDCINPRTCRGGQCVLGGTPNCEDADDDGYGVGDTTGCPECISDDKCEEDCADNDAAINPGLADSCDGKDNNCDGETDEPVPCESNFDCPEETPYTPTCDTGAGLCTYLPPNQLAGAQCREPVACVGGERPSPGDECF